MWQVSKGLMVPQNHISLLIANGRRAKEWQLGLRREGLAAERISTSGSDSAKGDYWLVIPEGEQFKGQRFVSDVLAGKRSLPRSAPVSGPLLWGAGLIVGCILAMVAMALLSRH